MISTLGAEPDHVTAELGPACLDDLAALAFVDGTCTPRRRTEILEHLETCSLCQELVAGVVEMLKEQDTILANADTEPAGPPKDAPEMIGAYRLGPQIAQGGMGRIYRAYDTSLGRDVALKLPRSGNDALARRFEREAAITAKLEHPGIVPIHGAGQTSDGTPFYVMRFIEGRTLDRLIEDASTPAQRLALVDRVLDVARAMAYVHGKHIVHRDLKPNNVLVGERNETVIIDWGLAKQLSDGRASLPVVSLGTDRMDTPATREALRTRAGEVMGTPAFMPPEQATGEPVDERADVYALGAILRNVITGSLPRNADAAIEGPTPVADVCRRAMAWEAEGRYPDAKAFATALEAALVASRPRPGPPRSPLIWLAAAVTLLAVAIVVMMVLARRGALQGMHRRVIARQNGDALYLSLSPGGKRVSFGGRERFQVIDIATGKSWARTDWLLWPWVVEFQTEDDVTYPAAGEQDTLELTRWNVQTDQLERTAKSSIATDGYWMGSLKDGALFMPTDDARYLEIHRGGARQKLPSESTRQLRVYAIAPTRDRVAFVDYAATGTVIRVCDLAGATFTSPVIDEVAALSWFDAQTLVYTTGTSDGSTLWRAVATPAGLASPVRLYETELGGWLGTLASRAGRIVASWITSSYETHLFNRDARADGPLNKTAASAALAWLDQTTFLAYSNSTGAIEKHSISARVLPQMTSLRLTAEPVSATRAGDIVIAALRTKPGRTIVAGTLTEAQPRWTAKPNELAFVRCAGDRQAPCVAGKQGADGRISLVTIDPQTGALGADVIGDGVIIDAAVNDAGTEVAWIVEYRAMIRRPLDRSAPAQAIENVGAGNHSLAYDPNGGILATGASVEGRRILRFEDAMQTTELTAGNAIVTLVRPSPDGSYILYRARTLNAELVEIR